MSPYPSLRRKTGLQSHQIFGESFRSCLAEKAAITYKEKLDDLHDPQSAVVFSAAHNDEAPLARHHTTEKERRDLIARFLKRDDPLSILIVCDMLLTGFDAPVEQVIYLDAPLREHTLLQAIARVNRPAEGKTYGLVVDYWGVSDNLQEALEMFVPQDVFAESMDILLPDPEAARFSGDLRWLGKIRQGARARYDRSRMIGLGDCGGKVRRLIEEAIVAEGIQILVQPIPLLSPQLDLKLAALETDEAKASEMEHALRAEIHVHLEEDPAFYESLRDPLLRILEDKKARRIDAAEELARSSALRQEVADRGKAAADLGLTP